MALPTIGGPGGQKQLSPSQEKRKGFANNSKNMDQILNNNTSKDYPQLDEYYKRTANRTQQLVTAQNVLKAQTLGALSGKVDFQQPPPQFQTQQPRSINTIDKNAYDYANDKNENYGRDFNANLDDYKPGIDETKFRRVPSLDRYYDNPNEDKATSLEKMYNNLQEQVKNLEKQLYNETRRYRSSYDNEREMISRLESTFRLHEDNVNVLNTELTNKLAILESRLLKEERAKQDLREKLFATEQNQKELMVWFKGLQSTVKEYQSKDA